MDFQLTMNYQRKMNTFTAFLINYSIVLRREPTQQEVEHQIELYITTTSKGSNIKMEFDPDQSLWRELRQEMNLSTYKTTLDSFEKVKNKYHHILQTRFYKAEYMTNRQEFLKEFNEKLKSIIEDQKKKIGEKQKTGKKSLKDTSQVNCPKCDTVIQKCEMARHQKTQKCDMMSKSKLKMKCEMKCVDCGDNECDGTECDLPEGSVRSMVFGERSKRVDIPVVDVVEEIIAQQDPKMIEIILGCKCGCGKKPSCEHGFRKECGCLICETDLLNAEECGHGYNGCFVCESGIEVDEDEEVKVEVKVEERCGHNRLKKNCLECVDEEEAKAEKKSKRCEHGLKKRKCKQCC